MKITQKTQDWGNSTGIRLPKKVLNQVNWKSDQTVSLDVDGNNVILRPVKEKAPVVALSLKKMIEKITPENIHDAVNWNDPVGKEVW